MQFIPQQIPEMILIKPTLFRDDRGYFMETRHNQKMADAGIQYDFVQDNFSFSEKSVLRGLHYQAVKPQGKLVKALKGEIFDVAVDLRQTSPTFGQWVSAILSSENHHQLWVPPGFAHGFYVLSDHAEVLYSCTDFYAPSYERSIVWNDPDLNIPWPIDKNIAVRVSPKDSAGKLFREAEYF